MHYYLVCPIGTIGGKEDFLTYHSKTRLQRGAIVSIPFGRQTKTGVVMKSTSKPKFITKEITKVFDEVLPTELLDLAIWMSDYYAVRISLVLQVILPKGFGKKRRSKDLSSSAITRKQGNYTLSKEQAKAVKEIGNSSEITHLLHGITGSGKTRVYQELAKKTLDERKSVVILVPEISLTPQLAAEFTTLHNNVAILHSGLSEAKRHIYWQTLRSSDQPWVVVGPRSALFAPLKNIGLIVIDECHEPSYAQDAQPKYSALRAARKLAELHKGAKLVLGSATPLVSDYFLATATNTPIVQLFNTTQKRNTSVEIVDMTDREQFGNHPIFSKLLLEKMNNSFVQNEQILLYHNRRGTARMALCSSCGWSATCPHCHIPVRLHHDFGELHCHVCGTKQRLPQTCPDCKGLDINFKGFGSKRIESEVRKLFPNANVARFDSDTPASEQLHHRYQDLYDNNIQIIIGTQGIAKGLDLPHLNTVGIVQADSELFIPDFSSSERSFQLTTQVIGRAGRTGAKSSVVIQTFNPEHPAVLFAKDQDYQAFYNYELSERAAEHMPPHTHLLHITVGYASKRAAENAAHNMSQTLKKTHPSIHVRGPSPAFHEHKGTQYYQQLTISSSKRSTLIAIAKNLPQRWQFTLDPLNLL